MAKKISPERIAELKTRYPHLAVFGKEGDPLLQSDWLNPFVYYEERDRLSSLSLGDRLACIFDHTNKTLLMAEDLVLTSIARPGVNRAYYNNWCKEANQTFMLTVRLKRRRAEIEAKNAKKNTVNEEEPS